MTTKASHHGHTFGINFFGTISYISILFVWLLVIDTIATIASLTQVLVTASNSLTTLGGTTTQTTTQTSVQDHASLQFLLVIALVVFTWIFCYLVAKTMSHTLRHFFVLFGRKLTIVSLSTVKYFILSAGLIGLVILLQFVPSDLNLIKMAIALLGLVGGLAGVTSIWLQRIAVERHRIAIAHVL
jgi:hypothetical protein